MRLAPIDLDPLLSRMSELFVEAIARLYQAAATGDTAAWERWLKASQEIEEVLWHAQQMGLSVLRVVEMLQPELKELSLGQEELRRLAALLAALRLAHPSAPGGKAGFFSRFLIIAGLIGAMVAGNPSLASAHTALSERQALELVEQTVQHAPEAARLIQAIEAHRRHVILRVDGRPTPFARLHTPEAGFVIYVGEDCPDHETRLWTFWVDPATSAVESLDIASDRWQSLAQWRRGLYSASPTR